VYRVTKYIRWRARVILCMCSELKTLDYVEECWARNFSFSCYGYTGVKTHEGRVWLDSVVAIKLLSVPMTNEVNIVISDSGQDIGILPHLRKLNKV
jgi:hypothetical protein